MALMTFVRLTSKLCCSWLFTLTPQKCDTCLFYNTKLEAFSKGGDPDKRLYWGGRKMEHLSQVMDER
jgi:hypothetical protein